MYGLCDCNNFYASCQRVFRPDLVGRPVVVLSNNDGCIIARSNEAKALGIGMGQPLYQVQGLIDRHGVAVFSANFALYGDMSRRVMATLRTLVPSVEVYSIDEAFFDLHGIAEPLDDYGRRIGRTIRRNTGIPVSIGIAPTKTLAKIASKLAKRYPKLDGCCYMHRPEDIEKVLATFPLHEVWGIGRRYGKLFDSMRITTARQFVELPEEWIHRHMGVIGSADVARVTGHRVHRLRTDAAAESSRSPSRAVSPRRSTSGRSSNASSRSSLRCAPRSSAPSVLSAGRYTDSFSPTATGTTSLSAMKRPC